MKLIIAFFRLVRSLNLLFIVLAQFLFQYCIVVPSFHQHNAQPVLTTFLFIALTFASICISAAGYIINDYFDLDIDQVNKPYKLVVEKFIKRRWAIFWHLTLSSLGILISFYVGWKINNLLLGVVNSVCVLLLWFYSTTFKKQLLLGNIIISLLTAWVILVLYFCETPRYTYETITEQELLALSRIFKLAVLYGGFAFIISLIREVIKDMEDMPGDVRYGCRTMPIAWGVNVTKVFAATWLTVLIAAVIIIQIYGLQFKWWWQAGYSLLFIIFPLLIIFRKLFPASNSQDFRQLSNGIKFVMFAGILSVVFFLNPS
jgi:4-hydroxybenzoate polyprenyltransferase